jgi:hypothetical protein
MGAARFLDKAVTEDDRGVIDRFSDGIAAEILITTMWHQWTFGGVWHRSGESLRLDGRLVRRA